MKVAVLAGGRSAEREVSLRSGGEVAEALRRRGHDVRLVDLDARVWETLRDGGFDCAFVALHGRLGEDGTVQGMLEILGLPYTGSGVLASALCIDKSRANRALAAAGLDVPDFEELDGAFTGGEAERLLERLGAPVVVKPVREGSTIGLTIAHEADALADGIMLAARYDRRVMCQRFVKGVEITVGVLAAPVLQVLPTLEIVSENPVYDYDAKYTPGKSHHIIPARVPEEATRRAAAAAGDAFQVLGCDGMARVDFIVADDGTPWFLEVNTVPGLTPVSLLPDAVRAAGMSFEEFCEAQVRHALARAGGRTS
jgi:D-alanine-D-alanine ligase